MDNEIDRKIDVTATLFLLVQNRQQTHDLTPIGSGANGHGIQEVKTVQSFIDLCIDSIRRNFIIIIDIR